MTTQKIDIILTKIITNSSDLFLKGNSVIARNDPVTVNLCVLPISHWVNPERPKLMKLHLIQDRK